jgi:hypothetical protein
MKTKLFTIATVIFSITIMYSCGFKGANKYVAPPSDPCTEKVKMAKAPNLKIDAVRFSDNVTSTFDGKANCNTPYLLGNTKDYGTIMSFISKTGQGQNTSAYYALDVALDRIEFVKNSYLKEDPNTKYYVIMLTDGLDNNSIAKNPKMTSREMYAEAIQKRMSQIFKKSPNAFKSYVLLYEGKDWLANDFSDDDTKKILDPFTGSAGSATERPRPINGKDFGQLAERFQKEFTSYDFDFSITAGYRGQTCRMLLKDAPVESEKIWIEADFIYKKKQYQLENIKTSAGLTYNKAAFINKGVKKDESNVSFSFKDLKLKGESREITNKEKVTQWFYEYGKPLKNSEYGTKDSMTQDAYVILIMDESSSYSKEDFKASQELMMKIIADMRKKL